MGQGTLSTDTSIQDVLGSYSYVMASDGNPDDPMTQRTAEGLGQVGMPQLDNAQPLPDQLKTQPAETQQPTPQVSNTPDTPGFG